MLDENESEGLSRRSLLKRSAVVGGTMVWAVPVVQSFTSPAFGQTDGTPGGKDFSYIALGYRCNQGIYRSVKFEFGLDANGNPVIEDCETGNFNTPAGPGSNCDFETGDSDSLACTTRFSINYLDGLKTIQVCINTGGESCVIEGVGVGKCGAVGTSSGGECVYRDAGPDGAECLTFALCAA